MRSVTDARTVSANLAGFLIADYATRPAVQLIGGERDASRKPLKAHRLLAADVGRTAVAARTECVVPPVGGLVGSALAPAKNQKKKSRRGSHGGKRGSAKP